MLCAFYKIFCGTMHIAYCLYHASSESLHASHSICAEPIHLSATFVQKQCNNAQLKHQWVKRSCACDCQRAKSRNIASPAGIPTEKEYIQMYCQARGIGVPDPTTYAFCQALSMFRIAAILAGVGARAQQGNASSKHAAQVCEVTASMMVVSCTSVLPAWMRTFNSSKV